MMITIRELRETKGAVCERILRSLPLWFGIESAIQHYIGDVEGMPAIAADFEAASAVGFLSLNFHNEFNAEIHVMGLLPEYQGKGIGTALIRAAERFAQDRGARFLTVKTLSPSRENREYEMTRRFYRSVGFVPLEEFKELWGPANPCLLMIKSL